MAKKLYSLMLSEEVVRALDREAHRRGTNRSALADRLLAEALTVRTQAVRTQDILEEILSLFSEDLGLVPQFVPNTPSLSLKSMLEYRYRPTVRYEVTLSAPGEEADGFLTVFLRTQSAALLAAIGEFFTLWHALEAEWGLRSAFLLSDGKITRSLSFSENPFFEGADGTRSDEAGIADAIAAYIRILDRGLKGILAGTLDERGLRRLYREYLASSPLTV